MHKPACSAWIRHGKTLYDDFEYNVENCPHYSKVAHGRFIIDRERDVIRCSACGFELPTLIPYICDGKNWVPVYERKYCGNCGAKMEATE